MRYWLPKTTINFSQLRPRLQTEQMSYLKQRKSYVLAIFLFVVGVVAQLYFPSPVHATAPTVAYVRFDRHATGAAISGTLCLNTTTTGTEAKVLITFPSGWTTSTTAADWTTTTTNLPSGASAWPTIGSPATSASGASGGTVTFSSGDLSSSTLYCFNFAGANSTIGSAGNDKTGSFETETSGNAQIDLINWATSVVASGADQVSVTASVSQTFTFSLSGTSIALGALTAGTVASGNVVQTVSTNARDGWISWVKSLNGNLKSTSNTALTITSPGSYPTLTDLTGSNYGYGLDAVTGTNSPTIASGYNGTGANSDSTSIGHLDTTFDQTASQTSGASGSTVTMNVRTRVSATQAPASDYADTLTFVAAGNF